MRPPLLLSFLALCAGLTSCATMQASSLPPIRSTQGTTLVRDGVVVEIGGGNDGRSPATLSVVVKFEDGETNRYATDSAADIRVGDQVAVSENRGKLRISRR